MIPTLALLSCATPMPSKPDVPATDDAVSDSHSDQVEDSPSDPVEDSPSDSDSAADLDPVGLRLIGDDVLHFKESVHALERHLNGAISDTGALTASYTYTFAFDENLACDGVVELSGVADDARCPTCDWVFDLEIVSESRADTDRCTLEAWEKLDAVDGFSDFAFAFTPDYNYYTYYYRGDLVIRGSRDAFLVGTDWTDPADSAAEPVSLWSAWADARSAATMVRTDTSLTFDESKTELWYDWAWFDSCDVVDDDRYVVVEDASRASGTIAWVGAGSETLADVYTFEAEAGQQISVLATGDEPVSVHLGAPNGCLVASGDEGELGHVAEESGVFTVELYGASDSGSLDYDLAVGIVPP